MKYLITVLVLFGMSTQLKAADVSLQENGNTLAVIKNMNRNSIVRVYSKTGKFIGEINLKNNVFKAKPKKKIVEKKKNTLILHAGKGKSGLRTEAITNGTKVVEDSSLVGAITYCRDIDSKLGLCLTGISNKTGLLGLKFGF